MLKVTSYESYPVESSVSGLVWPVQHGPDHFSAMQLLQKDHDTPTEQS